MEALAVADRYRLPPSRVLRLPWPEWGETDAALVLAYADHRRSLCPCGCGQHSDVCQDEATAGRWQVTVQSCAARATLEEYEDDHKDDLPKGALLGVHLLPPGEKPEDSLEYDPERAQRAYAEMQARLGIDQAP